MKLWKIQVWVVVLLALFVGSCIPLHKQIPLNFYGNHEGEKIPYDYDTSLTFERTPSVDYRIQNGDVLDISINTTVFNEFDKFSDKERQSQNPQNPLLRGYPVDDSGMVTIPFAGKVKVVDMTLTQIRRKIHDVMTAYFNNVTVKVNLLTYRFYVMGEVRNPGKIETFKSETNLYEVLGMAGGISKYGDLTRVKVLRKTKKGMNVQKLDLTGTNSIKNSYFQIRPEDVIYVSALPQKRVESSESISMALRGLTSIMVAANAFITVISFIQN